MPISYPRADLFDLCNIVDATFWPLNRQELSRVAGGKTQAKDLGPTLWRATFKTAPALMADAADIEAALISLNGSAGSFLAYDVRRPFPRMYPDGAFLDVATIGALDAGNAFSITLAGLPEGFTLMPRDNIGFLYGAGPSRALHTVTAGGSALADGTLALSVFPAIRPGASVGAAVTLKRAPCEMILEPGQQPPGIHELVASSVSFSAVQIF